MAKAQNKTVVNDACVVEFIASIQDQTKRADCEYLIQLLNQISKAPAKMWGASIVGFGEYHYKYDSGREGNFCRVAFSPRKQNLTLYLMNGFDDYKDDLQKLGKHKIGKSCLYVKKLDDLDKKVLTRMFKDSLAYMKKKYGPDKSPL